MAWRPLVRRGLAHCTGLGSLCYVDYQHLKQLQPTKNYRSKLQWVISVKLIKKRSFTNLRDKKGLDHPTAAIQFELDLTKLTEVIGPFAKSIQCLESTHSTPADVFLFWLAIMAHLDQLFRDQKIQLPSNVVEQIRAITNRRYNGMINNGPTDVYIAAFFLDPRKLVSCIHFSLDFSEKFQVTVEQKFFVTQILTHLLFHLSPLLVLLGYEQLSQSHLMTCWNM